MAIASDLRTCFSFLHSHDIFKRKFVFRRAVYSRTTIMSRDFASNNCELKQTILVKQTLLRENRIYFQLLDKYAYGDNSFSNASVMRPILMSPKTVLRGSSCREKCLSVTNCEFVSINTFSLKHMKPAVLLILYENKQTL